MTGPPLFSTGTVYCLNAGSGSTLDGLSHGTILQWFRPSSLGADAAFVNKYTTTFTGLAFLPLAANPAGLRFALDRSTTDMNLRTSHTCLELGEWCANAAVFNGAGAEADQHFYTGRIDAAMAEVSSYVSRTVGSGTLIDTDARDLGIGNLAGNAKTWVNTNGAFFMTGIWKNRSLTLAELEIQARNPWRVVVHAADCVGFWNFSTFDGSSGVRDLSGSGNHITVESGPIPITISPPMGLAEPFYNPAYFEAGPIPTEFPFLEDFSSWLS